MRDRTDDGLYAVKMIQLPAHLRDNEIAKALREMQALAVFRNNKHVVGYVTAWIEEVEGNSGSNLYIQMELCEGNLKDWISNRNSRLGTGEGQNFQFNREEVDFLSAFKLFFEIVWSLSYLHDKRYIHRDLKPANILFSRDENNSRILKLADLGQSKLVEDDLQLHTTQVCSPLYAAPELCNRRGYARYNAKVDMYMSCSRAVLQIFPTQRQAGTSP